MIVIDREKFSELCREDRCIHGSDGDSIGTYNEKRIHRILKRYITEDAFCYEQRVGRYVADVVTEESVFEIQTASFRSLAKKVEYYLESTDKTVYILHPVIKEKMLIRAERETGEVLSRKRSPKRVSDFEAVSNMYALGELVKSKRLVLCLVYIRAEEYRFSEARRYCKAGKYDNDLCPCELIDIRTLSGAEDYRALVPAELSEREFDASEFSKISKLKARKLYSLLNTLTSADVLCKRADGRKNMFSVKK